jgi:hypothetical protein
MTTPRMPTYAEWNRLDPASKLTDRTEEARATLRRITPALRDVLVSHREAQQTLASRWDLDSQAKTKGALVTRETHQKKLLALESSARAAEQQFREAVAEGLTVRPSTDTTTELRIGRAWARLQDYAKEQARQGADVVTATVTRLEQAQREGDRETLVAAAQELPAFVETHTGTPLPDDIRKWLTIQGGSDVARRAVGLGGEIDRASYRVHMALGMAKSELADDPHAIPSDALPGYTEDELIEVPEPQTRKAAG